MPASDVAGLVAAPPAAAHPRGKLGRVLDAVAARDGATLAELAALTGWQPHTTRAALTGLRRRGFVLVLGRVDDAGGRKVYRLRPEVPA
jgi:DNA-binding IclR family transcriptional regulator